MGVAEPLGTARGIGEVAACRKKWKLAPKPKPAPCTVVDEEEARRVKRKIQENEEKKIIEAGLRSVQGILRLFAYVY